MEQRLQEGLGHVSPQWWLHEGQHVDPAQGRDTRWVLPGHPVPPGPDPGGPSPGSVWGLVGSPWSVEPCSAQLAELGIPRVAAGNVQAGRACWTVAPAGGQGEAGQCHGWSPPPHSQIKTPFRHKGDVLQTSQGHGYSRGSVLLGSW